MLYSIIIPHKNIPELLQRCIDSIPFRENCEILVVDDCSDPKVVDFLNFPGIDRTDVKLFFTSESKGAGYARNIGLREACGKWIIFADADDFFLPDFWIVFDKYSNSNFDIVFFTLKSVNSLTMKPASRHLAFNELVYKSIGQKDLNWLRYARSEVYGKMIQRDIVINNNICFDETPVSNDVWFSIRSGYFAKKIAVDKTAVYCITYRDNSLVYSINESLLDTRVNVHIKVYKFLLHKSLLKYRGNILFWVFKYKKISYVLYLKKIFLLATIFPISLLIKDYFLLWYDKIKGFRLKREKYKVIDKS